MVIPILILTMDRPIQLRDMIESIEKHTDLSMYRIIICDNGSKQNTLDYLKTLETKYIVNYNGENLLFEGLNIGLKSIDEPYFIISDPDILLNENISTDWPIKMAELLKEQYNCPKIGMALNIDFKEKSILTDKIKLIESPFWCDKVNTLFSEPCYYAMTDTTMCMYRRDTYSYWRKNERLCFDREHGIVDYGYISQDFYNKKYTKKSIRIAGNFTAKHLGWYLDKKYLPDIDEYWQGCNQKIASSLFTMKDMIKEYHGIK